MRRGDEASEVVVVDILGAPRSGRRGRRRRRAAPAEPAPEPTELPLTRATVVRPDDLGGVEAAARWLERVSRDPTVAEGEVADGLHLLNRALHAHRAAAQDPYVSEVSAERAVAIRIGYGSGDEVAEGRWSEARELAPSERRTRRTEALQPQERVAAVLGGRDAVLASETLILRARLDLDQGRTREAALGLRVGLEALLRELGEAGREGDERASLAQRRDGVVDAADEALRGDLEPARDAELDETLALCERALRRRRFGFG